MTYNIIYASCKSPKGDHPYQDFIKVSETERYLLAALADGLGSSKHSAKGASLICDVLSDLFSKFYFGNSSVREILHNAIGEWYKRLEKKEVNPKDYLTTSSFIFIDKNSHKATFGFIGDSLIAFRKGASPIITLSEEKDFLNETNCIGTSKHPQYNITEIDIDSSLDFIIASDGFGDELIAEKIGQLFNYLIGKYSRTKPQKRNRDFKIELSSTMRDKNSDDKSVIFGWIQSQM